MDSKMVVRASSWVLRMLSRSTFAFERPEEAFHHRVIPTIAFATHADLNALFLQEALRLLRWYTDTHGLSGAINPLGLALRQRHGKCLLNERRVKGGGPCPANNPSRKQVESHGKARASRMLWQCTSHQQPTFDSAVAPQTGDRAHSPPHAQADWRMARHHAMGSAMRRETDAVRIKRTTRLRPIRMPCSAKAA